MRTSHLGLVAFCFLGGLALGCENKAEIQQKALQEPTAALGASSSIKDLMRARGLSDADVESALETYVPSGKHDECTIFASGGQSGQVLVIGVPSMRLLNVIGVFTPRAVAGLRYGYGGNSDAVIAHGAQSGHSISWGDCRPSRRLVIPRPGAVDLRARWSA